jgi:hypothetical protein
MEDLTQSNCELNSFHRWQADYAAHGVATFPVDANKRPMVNGITSLVCRPAARSREGLVMRRRLGSCVVATAA